MAFGVDNLRFFTSYWYDDVDLVDLERRFGAEFMEKIYFHIIAFEANKLTSLKPDILDLGPFERHHTAEFEELWLTIQRNVWAQWRYENNLPDYAAPRFTTRPVVQSSSPIRINGDNPDILLFCGGGKDSLVSLKMLERAGLSYATCAYSNAIYGHSAPQHELIADLLSHAAQPARQHKIWIYEDFLDSPVLELAKEYQVNSLAAAETPSSVFAALPIILQHGYRHIALGHERSADAPNLIWERTGEAINHQWGKSTQAEKLLDTYLRDRLVSNCHYFSLLKPIHDVVIFNMLRRDLACIPFTHSCNIAKPWCKKCAKCAYVWLNYMAYLPITLVDEMFHQVNLFDLPENQFFFKQLLGLDEHTPFECIGQIDESRLAFEICRRKGLTGKAMEMFIDEIGIVDIPPAMDEYVTVDEDHHLIPPEIAQKIMPSMKAGARVAKEYLAQLRLEPTKT
uniref:UDP-N-acetyl-alpha-D-muramoyl-L-alanyl-L-glutamate epimerase n=1 Tax=Candidatus Kentrum sp. UNK TaxID=2126344 RepID=A0A451ABB6_9GAMM|nr:MAG: hypothetical protein BECKUNK1418G_GA0071005_10326 [Candidatus Kentron sp. UNK]VFK70806.1 MAG: hypothetical protein BECKUNK1418H_GA0071006_10396 [Candidatus Kentron sp. UNK]